MWEWWKVPSSTRIPLIHSLLNQSRGTPPTITTDPYQPHCQARQTPHGSPKSRNPLPHVCIDNYKDFHINTFQITLIHFRPTDFTFWPVIIYCVDASSMMPGLLSCGPVAPAAYDLLLCHGHLHRVHKRVFWSGKLYRKCNENYKSHWQIICLEKCD